MTLNEFLAHATTGQVLSGEEVGAFMHQMSEEARQITFQLNNQYHSQEEIQKLLQKLTGKEIDESVRIFPPLYADFGKNIRIGKNVFINACCHFQDHGGIEIGDNCQIGHNVVFATLNHGILPKDRKNTYPAAITLKKNVWVGSNSTILQGVTIGNNAIIAAGSVVTRSVPDNVIVGGVPAKIIRTIKE